jgi:hypothetical protein
MTVFSRNSTEVVDQKGRHLERRKCGRDFAGKESLFIAEHKSLVLSNFANAPGFKERQPAPSHREANSLSGDKE